MYSNFNNEITGTYHKKDWVSLVVLLTLAAILTVFVTLLILGEVTGATDQFIIDKAEEISAS